MLIGENAHPRAQYIVAGRELADRFAEPSDAGITGEHELLVAGMAELGGPRVDLARERLLRGSAKRLAFRTGGSGIGGKLEAREPPDRVALDDHFAGFGNFSFEHRVLAQPPHQHAGATVNETLGETLMQRVGQSVLHATGDALPVLGI